MSETEIEKKKKEKRMKKDSRALITWGTGFIIIVLVMMVLGEYRIYISDLALIGISLIFLGGMLPFIVKNAKEIREKRELKKYDTGGLALSETE